MPSTRPNGEPQAAVYQKARSNLYPTIVVYQYRRRVREARRRGARIVEAAPLFLSEELAEGGVAERDGLVRAQLLHREEFLDRQVVAVHVALKAGMCMFEVYRRPFAHEPGAAVALFSEFRTSVARSS